MWHNIENKPEVQTAAMNLLDELYSINGGRLTDLIADLQHVFLGLIPSSGMFGEDFDSTVTLLNSFYANAKKIDAATFSNIQNQ